MQTVNIDIVSDIACPWCAIGYARLEQAMQQLQGEMNFRVRWHAFELNPAPGKDGVPILEALSQKYGRSIDEMRAAQANMMDIAAGLGLNFERMQERLTRNTFDAHRLVKWADEYGRQTEMKMALFDAYFGHAANVADPEVLARCAETVGLDGDKARQVLASNAYADDVREDEARAQEAGVSAVPAFIVNEEYLISGAQESAYLAQALRQIAGEPSEED